MRSHMRSLFANVFTIIIISLFLIVKAPYPIYKYAEWGGLLIIGLTLLIMLMEADEQRVDEENIRRNGRK